VGVRMRDAGGDADCGGGDPEGLTSFDMGRSLKLTACGSLVSGIGSVVAEAVTLVAGSLISKAAAPPAAAPTAAAPGTSRVGGSPGPMGPPEVGTATVGRTSVGGNGGGPPSFWARAAVAGAAEEAEAGLESSAPEGRNTVGEAAASSPG